jgi:hypothetical protein
MATIYALPAAFNAGDTVVYTKQFPTYPASDGWALTLSIAGPSVQSITGSASGPDWIVTLAASMTALLVSGDYRWIERVSKAGDTYPAGSGRLYVAPDLSAAGAGDTVSWESTTLAAIKAYLSGSLATGIQSYQIAGRAVSSYTLAEITKLQAQLQAVVNRQRSGGAISTPVVFTLGRNA